LETETRLAECQRVIGYHFATPELLEVALRHSSLRTPDRECNERLEFLGDSVLGLVITEELYRLLPDQAEGELTRIKSAVVARGALYRASQKLGLVRFAEFARGVGKREELPVSVTANLVEAVIGAIYLDAGFFPAREFVLRHLGHEIDETLSDRGAKNYKSLLQHEVQQGSGQTPTYRTIEEEGPRHRREFVVAAVIGGKEWGRAGGPTKKEAEQEAARLALEAWERRGHGRRRRGAGRREGRGPLPAAPVEAAAEVRATDAPAEPEVREPLPLSPPPLRGGWEEPEPDEAPESSPPAREFEPEAEPPARERGRRGGRGGGGRGRREERAPRGRPAAPPPPPAAPPPAPSAPSGPSFAEGIPDVPVAPARRAHEERREEVPAQRMDPKRKAPTPPAPPPSQGFDAGI
jgi:ribonuclease-3